MPELPEVEVLVRHLRPRLVGRVILDAKLHRERSGRPESPASFRHKLKGFRIDAVRRRAKHLLFDLQNQATGTASVLLGHLGMTGRMYVTPRLPEIPKHTVATFNMPDGIFVFEDTRYFGRMNFELKQLDALGPEPLDDLFTPDVLAKQLSGSRQAIKVKLLDQTAIAGIGNIYASEALWRARIGPTRQAGTLTSDEYFRLHGAIKAVLHEAISFGSTVPLEFSTGGKNDGLFYYGAEAGIGGGYEERLRVYDRAGQPCERCGNSIKRSVQVGRSTFHCAGCQKR